MAIEYYDDIWECITSKTEIKEQVAIIDSIIAALRQSLLKRAGKAGTKEYQINDGQTIVRVEFTSMKEMSDTMAVLKRDKQELLQGPNGFGRVFVGKDRDSFR